VKRAGRDEALARGVTLRFTGSVFEEAERVGRGPTYRLHDVMRRVRRGRALIVCVGDEYGFEIEVRAPPKRTSEALAEAVGAR
jgi:hypothetical protein